MSLFKKRKGPNIRQRRFGEDEDDDHVSSLVPSVVDTPGTTGIKKDKKKNKEKKPIGGGTAVLSFGDELEADDGIVFQEKKSSLSYKLRKEMKKERKEKKREEKEKMKNQDDKFKEKNGTSHVTELDDLGIRIVNGREAEAIAHQPGDSDSDDNDFEQEGKHKFKQRTTPKTLDPWKKMLQSGTIPDANMIHLIRKKRQQAREMGDMIPVDDTVRVEQNKSRLIREDDNDRSDDESTRLDFTVTQDQHKERKEAFLAAQDEDGQVSDHDNEWEKQQLLKSGANSKLMSDEGSQPAIDPLTAPSMMSWTNQGESLIPPALTRPTNYQAEGIIKRLKDSRDSCTEVHRRHKLEYESSIDQLVSCKLEVTSAESRLGPLTQTFQFYQDLRGYVTDLRECLNEKVGEIGRLEQQVYLLYRQRSQKLVQRRRQDVKDQNNVFSPFAGKASLADEQRTRRAAEREGRRTRRRREREKKNQTQHHSGTSTDEELPHSEQQLMQSNLDKIFEDAQTVFEDVEDDFSQLKNIMVRFESWRDIDSPTYSDAYVSFNLPKLFAPYIRLQLLLWNPFSKESSSVDVEKMSWYHMIAMYGSTEHPLHIDPDRKLMSHIVEKIILAKLKELVECCWDPLSHMHTVRLVNLVRHFTQSCPSINASSKPLMELTKSIIAKIRDAIENDVFIPMFPKTVYEVKTSGVSLFFQRQFWVAWKLLSSVLMWHNVLSDTVIHDLAIRSLLNLYLLPALNLASEININDALDKCRNVINALPRAWAKADTNNGNTHVYLTRFEAVLVALAVKLDPSKNTFELKEIVDLLKQIGAKTQSETINNKYL